jgi:hypothetical protein
MSAAFAALRSPHELHDTVGLRIGQRLQENGMDDAENRGVGTDAKRKREQRRNGERRRSAERPDRIPDVLADRLEPSEPD